MMYPRLFLAKNLLRDDGVIFIHIDDNEVHNLRLMMNEIFGEENFIECITWNKRVPKNDKGIGNIHEYILIYVKNNSLNHEFLMKKNGLEDIDDLVQKLKKKKVPLTEAEKEIQKLYNKKGYDRGITLYNSLDKDFRLWGKINMSWPNANTFGPRYEVKHPKTGKAVKIPDRGWRWKEDTFNDASGIINGNFKSIVELHDGSFMCGKIWFDKDENTQPSSINYLDEVDSLLLRSILSLKSDGGIEVEKLFEGKSIFSYPKPTSLDSLLIKSLASNDNGIILDFFGGSGTTAQAVLELNKEDGGNRKFILVQLPEKCDENSEAYKAGYKTIADIAKERIRRVIKNLTPNPSPSGEGNGGDSTENLFKGANPSLFENAHQLRLVDKTEAEEKLWQCLRNRKIENCKFRRQHPIGKFVADFYCHEKKLVVEVDGGYHNEQEQKEHDEARTQIINEYGITVIRFTNDEILNNLQSVINKITAALKSSEENSPLSKWRGAGGEVGFKVFKLSTSNFKIWRGNEITEENLEKQLDAFTNPVREGSEKENVLYELILKAGYPLHTPLSKWRGAGGEVYSINDGELIIALEEMNQKLIAQIISVKPKKVITLDNLFTGNDKLKTNTVLQMRDAEIDFKTI